jgi:hypothetical protein
MKIYVVQYYDGMSPEGYIIAVKSSLATAKSESQGYEDRLDHDSEELKWHYKSRNHGPWNADGCTGGYEIGEWEVST